MKLKSLLSVLGLTTTLVAIQTSDFQNQKIGQVMAQCNPLDITCNPHIRDRTRKIAEEAWGEAGRGLYQAGAAAIGEDNKRIPLRSLTSRQKELLRPEFGSLVDKVRVKYGGNLYLHPNSDNENNNHLWTITPLSDGYFMIISKRNGSALDANGGTGNLYLHPNPDKRNPNHYWRLVQVGGYYMITSRVNGYALDANGGTGNLYLHPNPDKNNSSHLWKFVEVGNFKIIGSALKN